MFHYAGFRVANVFFSVSVVPVSVAGMYKTTIDPPTSVLKPLPWPLSGSASDRISNLLP